MLLHLIYSPIPCCGLPLLVASLGLMSLPWWLVSHTLQYNVAGQWRLPIGGRWERWDRVMRVLTSLFRELYDADMKMCIDLLCMIDFRVDLRYVVFFHKQSLNSSWYKIIIKPCSANFKLFYKTLICLTGVNQVLRCFRCFVPNCLYLVDHKTFVLVVSRWTSEF